MPELPDCLLWWDDWLCRQVGGAEKMEPDSSWRCTGTGQERADNLKQGKSQVCIKKTSRILKVVTYQKRMPRQTVESQSLEMFKIQQVPKKLNLFDLALSRTIRWPQEVPSNLHNLMILWNYLLLSGLVLWPPSLIVLCKYKMFSFKYSHICCVLQQAQSHRYL